MSFLTVKPSGSRLILTLMVLVTQIAGHYNFSAGEVGWATAWHGAGLVFLILVGYLWYKEWQEQREETK